MRLYLDSLSALPRLNLVFSFTRPITLALALNNFGEGILKIKSDRLKTRAVPIIFRLLFCKIFLIANSCLVYIVDFLVFPSSLNVYCFQFFHYRNPLNPRTALQKEPPLKTLFYSLKRYLASGKAGDGWDQKVNYI